MKNDQEGGIKTDHFLTLDYNRGRRAYHFQKMDQLQRVRQSIFISMLYTTHYILSLSGTSSTLYLLFFTHQHRCKVFKYFLWATFSSPSISQRGINWLRVGSYWGPQSFTSCEGWGPCGKEALGISLSPHFSRCLNGTFPWSNEDIVAWTVIRKETNTIFFFFWINLPHS